MPLKIEENRGTDRPLAAVAQNEISFAIEEESGICDRNAADHHQFGLKTGERDNDKTQ